MALQFFTGAAFDDTSVGSQIVAPGLFNTQPRMLAVVAVRATASATVTTMVDTVGNTYVRDHATVVNTTGLEMWRSTLAAAQQANEITVTFNKAVADRAIIVAVYELGDLAAPHDNSSEGSSASSTVATGAFSTIAPPGQGVVLAAFTVEAQGQVWTPGPGYVVRLQAPMQYLMLAEKHYSAGLTNEVASASTPTGAKKSVVAVAYKAAILPPAVRAMHSFKQRNVWK